MLFAGIAMLLGSCLVFYYTGPADVFWASYLPVILLLPIISPAWRIFSIFLASILWTSLILSWQSDLALDSKFNNQEMRVQGQIIDIPQQHGRLLRFTLKPETIDGLDRKLPTKIRISWYHAQQQPRSGERWQFLLKLKRPHGFRNPTGFDYERWLFVNRIGALAYVRKSASNQKLQPAPAWHINKTRENIKNAIEQACAECNSVGLIQALSIGYKAGIKPEHRSVLQSTGTAHLLAISGLHIGLVAGLLYLMGNLLWGTLPISSFINRQLFAASLGLIAALIYSAFAGFSLPTVRAILMLSIVFVAMMLRMRINLLHSLSVAVIFILMVDPLAVGSHSFWLTFSALLIIAFGQMVMKYQATRWRQLLLIQFLFALLFIPISMAIFTQINTASFVANLVAIPLVSLLVVPLSLLGSLLSGFDLSIAAWVFQLTDFLLSGLVEYLQLLLDNGLDVVKTGHRPWWVIFLAAPAILLLLLPIRPFLKNSAILILFVVMFYPSKKIAHGGFKATTLDVGMGTSVVVQTRTHALVYDFGPGNTQGFSAARWVLLPFLQSENISRPDLLVFSHADQDHSGGFYSLENQFINTPIVSGEPGRIRQKFDLSRPVSSCHQSAAWHWDGVLFEFLSTDQLNVSSSANNHSCVLKISSKNHQLLLTGDIEKQQEQALVKKYGHRKQANLRADFMLAPHHGSLTSSSEEFIQAVDPSLAIFTAGYSNRWGFPKPAVEQRYLNRQISTLKTDQQGAISIQSEAEQAKIFTHRQLQPFMWY